MSALGALLGRIFSRGTEVELMGGLNFTGGLVATSNEATESVDVTLDPSVAAGFRANYYMDTTSTAVATGSSASPFTTFSATFARAAERGINVATIFVPPGSTISENIVFPEGGDWEIACQGTARATLTGTINITSVAQGVRRLTNIITTQPITGASSTGVGASNFLWLVNCAILNTITFTAAATGAFWWLLCNGRTSDFFSFGGFCNAAVTGPVEIMASDWTFSGPITPTSVSQMRYCKLPAAIDIGSVNGNLQLIGCALQGGTSFTGTGQVVLDGFTCTSFFTSNSVAASTIKVVTQNSNKALAATAFNANFSALNISSVIETAGLYELTVSLVKTVAGTAGTASFNVGTTDAAGAYTMPVVTLDVASESRKSGAVRFRSNGTAHITLACTGITTPGALAATYEWVLRRID